MQLADTLLEIVAEETVQYAFCVLPGRYQTPDVGREGYGVGVCGGPLGLAEWVGAEVGFVAGGGGGGG